MEPGRFIGGGGGGGLFKTDVGNLSVDSFYFL